MTKIQHENVVKLFEVHETPQTLFLVMEILTGGELFDRIIAKGHYSEADARKLAITILTAIKHLHENGVAHRDLKPENILLKDTTEDAIIKITDFGLSKESDTADTFCGTPVYLAPEIWLRKTYGYEVDWWSLGCVLYEMVCGLPPFWGDTIKDVYKKVIHSTPKYNPGAMSAECQALIEGLLQREQEAMIKEMERGIAKREAITLRYKGKARPTALEHTKQSLREHVKKLRGKIQATAREASQLSNAITNKKQELDTSTNELADATARYGSLETDANDLQQAINRLLYEKQRRAELQAAKEATVGRYLDLERGTAELRGPEHASEVDAALSRGAENLGRCRDVIAALGKRFDYLAEPLGRIKHLADDAGQSVDTVAKHELRLMASGCELSR